MSDYTHHREGMGGKGIVVGLLLIALFVVGLAFLGSSGSEVAPGTEVIDSGAAPVAADPAPAAIE